MLGTVESSPDHPSKWRKMSRARRVSRWIPALLWMALIFSFSSLQDVAATPAPDYLLHFNAYFILGVLVWWASALSFSWGWGLRLAILWLLSTTYGGSDEIHQMFVPGREASVADLVADSLGAAVALTLLTHPRLTLFRSCLLRRKPVGSALGVDTNVSSAEERQPR